MLILYGGVLYGSYRGDHMGIRLADHIVAELRRRGDEAELIDAKAIGLPIIDRMYKEYAPGTVPARSKPLTRSCSSSANTIGVCSPA